MVNKENLSYILEKPEEVVVVPIGNWLGAY
jgi:hypothetical protein